MEECETMNVKLTKAMTTVRTAVMDAIAKRKDPAHKKRAMECMMLTEEQRRKFCRKHTVNHSKQIWLRDVEEGKCTNKLARKQHMS